MLPSVAEYRSHQDTRLKYLAGLNHETPSPRPLELRDKNIVQKPLKEINSIPTKCLKFYSKERPPHFSYSSILLPISEHCLVVEVHYVGLNPDDVKLINSYSNYLNGEVGIGHEFSGIVAMTGEQVYEFKVGDKVMGIYSHANNGLGACETSLLIDPSVDVLVKVPRSISLEVAAGALYTLGTAYTILQGLEDKKLLNESSNIFINGGTTNLGLNTIQLLKYHYRIPKTIVVSCSKRGAMWLESVFGYLEEELLFVDYKEHEDLSVPLKEMIRQKELPQMDFFTGATHPTPFNQGRFSIVLDFIGGHDLLTASRDIRAPEAVYVTTVGDKKSDYSKDKYPPAWSTGIRSIFSKYMSGFYYCHYQMPFTPGPWTQVCASLLEDETVEVFIDGRFHWKDIDKALTRLRSGHTKGKVILEIERF